MIRLDSVVMLANPTVPTPATQPKNKLLLPVVLQQPAWLPMNVLWQPVVLRRPAL